MTPLGCVQVTPRAEPCCGSPVSPKAIRTVPRVQAHLDSTQFTWRNGAHGADCEHLAVIHQCCRYSVNPAIRRQVRRLIMTRSGARIPQHSLRMHDRAAAIRNRPRVNATIDYGELRRILDEAQKEIATQGVLLLLGSRMMIGIADPGLHGRAEAHTVPAAPQATCSCGGSVIVAGAADGPCLCSVARPLRSAEGVCHRCQVLPLSPAIHCRTVRGLQVRR